MASYFFMLSTDPGVDPRKCVIGLACAAEAVTQGHEVTVFFASHAVLLLQARVIDEFDDKVGMPQGASRALLDTVVAAATVACSTGSQAVVGVTPDNANGVLVNDDSLIWSGPPGVVAMSASADVTLSF